MNDVVTALRHAQEFTRTENTALIYWGRGFLAGYRMEANRAWSMRVLQEHYESMLPANPADRTVAQQTCLAFIAGRADAAEEALTALIGHNEEDEIINAELDKTVLEIESMMTCWCPQHRLPADPNG